VKSGLAAWWAGPSPTRVKQEIVGICSGEKRDEQMIVTKDGQHTFKYED
jgi:hypothetical protein